MYFIIKIYTVVQNCLDKMTGKCMFKQVYGIRIIHVVIYYIFTNLNCIFCNAVLHYRYL